jgi:hypothetical protein
VILFSALRSVSKDWMSMRSASVSNESGKLPDGRQAGIDQINCASRYTVCNGLIELAPAETDRSLIKQAFVRGSWSLLRLAICA